MNTSYRVSALAALLVAALICVPQARAQGGLGISVGLNFNDISDIEVNNREATFENAQGWHLAIWYDLALGPLAVRPGIRYMDAGRLFETEESVVPGVPEFGDIDVALIEIPIDLRIRLGFPFIKPYVMAGPVLRFPTGDAREDERFESFSLAGGLGAGVELGLAGIRLFPEVKYTFGISRFTKDSYEIGGIQFNPDERQNLNTVMLSVGIGL